MTKRYRAVDECDCQCGKRHCASQSHGSARGYNRGCRCSDCTKDNTARGLVQRSRVNAETRQQAEKSGQVWTSAELEVATRSDLTAREAAVLLGRTMQAVKNVRFKCEHDARFVRLLGSK